MCLGLPVLTLKITRKNHTPKRTQNEIARILKVNSSTIYKWARDKPLFLDALCGGIDIYEHSGLPLWAREENTVNECCNGAGFSHYTDLSEFIGNITPELFYDCKKRTPLVFYLLVMGCEQLRKQGGINGNTSV